jgi:hypothetical protein
LGQEQINTNTSNAFLLDRKIEVTTAGRPAVYSKLLYSISIENALCVIDYIFSLIEVNLSDNYRKDLINLLTKFSKSKDNKLFKVITRNDIVSFLDSFRKTENADPLHIWIGTYNIFRIHFPPHQLRFLKIISHHSDCNDQLAE